MSARKKRPADEKKTSSPLCAGMDKLVSPAEKRKYLTTSQLMARWGVSASTIIRLIEEGRLRGLKIRGVYRVAIDSVESYERKVAF